MQEDEKSGKALTLLFPQAKVYAVGDLLDFIAVARHPCEHHLTTAPRTSSFYGKWSIDIEDAVEIPAHEQSGIYGAVTDYTQTISMQEALTHHPSGSVCHACVEERKKTKSYLIERLLEAVNEKKFKLWDSYGGKVVAPPSDHSANAFAHPPSTPYVHRDNCRPVYNTAEWWAKMSCIYKADLIEFCSDEKIFVEFEGETAQAAAEKAAAEKAAAEKAAAEKAAAEKAEAAGKALVATVEKALLPIQALADKIAEALPTAMAPVTPGTGAEETKSVSVTEETKEEKSDRLKKRRSELIQNGVPNFNKVIAEEEKLSISRIKQLLAHKAKSKIQNLWAS